MRADFRLRLATLIATSLMAGACSDDPDPSEKKDAATDVVADTGAATDTGAANDTGGAADTDTTATDAGETTDAGTADADVTETLYDRLGKAAGIETVVKAFVGKVVADPKINGYFLNSTLDGAKLISCLVKQIGQATGGPEKYDCKDMKTAHKNMGVSKADFDDLVGHLVQALKDAKVAQADIDTIASVLLPMEKDIVEDPTNNKTVYQRVGRRPAIEKVVDEFIGTVVKNPAINSFFGKANAARLKTCLVRQVCGIDGPCQYGKEPAAGEVGVSDKDVCKDMKTMHKGMGIAHADFAALVGDLVKVLTANKVTAADIDALAGVLGPMCSDIVEKDGCTIYERLGKGEGIGKVVDSFLGKVLADPKINGYFLYASLNAAGLRKCLVDQIGSATGGPEKYTCKDMKTTHQGMGISKNDFGDLVGHLVAALKEAKVGQGDIDAIASVLLPMEKDIVEDPTNNKTVYQRIGRRPAIEKAVDDFIAKVVANVKIKDFFTSAKADRLKTCLVRQICSIDGPCAYGKEPATGEKGVSDKDPCKDMKSVHAGMNIAKADFDALVGDLVAVLKALTVPQTDIDAITGALGPMCSDIVTKVGESCK